MKEPSAERPDAKKIIDTLVEAMHRGTEHFDEAFSLVPGEYEVLLHREAYEELEPIFPYLRERAERRLDRELDRLNRGGLANLLRRLAAWLKALVNPGQAQQPASAPPARYKPAGFGWRISFSMPLNENVDVGYVGVAATLAAPKRDNLSGGKTLRLTLRGQDGNFQTHLLPAAEATLAANGGAPATRRSRPGAEEDAGGTPLARLSFRDDSGPRTFTMTTAEIAIGRGGDGDVHLLLQTLPDVSRVHLRLRYDAATKTFFVKDVSRFGTTVDGRPVKPSLDPESRRDLDRWEALPSETTLVLAGVLRIDFKSLV